MPAKTEKQRRLFQIALAIKRGHHIKGGAGSTAQKIARTQSEKTIREFTTRARKAHKRKRSRG